MTVWSRSQISVMATAAGWGSHATDASWVAMAESSGDDHVVNSIGAVGLMQINQPVHVQSHPNWTVAWLQSPINNLAAALTLFNAAGQTFGPDWASSKNGGGIPEGWGPHVSTSAGGTGGAVQADAPNAQDLCKQFEGTAQYQPCLQSMGNALPNANEMGGGASGSLLDTAGQIGRLAQAVATAGNWLANPENWLRIGYVVGGGILALVAVNVVIQPYAARASGQVTRALPIKTTKRYLSYRRANVEASRKAQQEQEEEGEEE